MAINPFSQHPHKKYKMSASTALITLNAPVIVRYSYEQMEACPGSGDIIIRDNYFEDGAPGKWYRHYYKMLKWNKKSAWLIECDENGKTPPGGGEKYARKDVPRKVIKKNMY